MERRIIVDHASFVVAHYALSLRFYTAALAPLGFTVLSEGGDQAGFGADALDDFWIGAATEEAAPTSGAHVAFVAESRAAVDAFYYAALANGGRERAGPPRIREEYSAGYYGAFVTDPDGNNVEAVFHEPQPDA